MFTLEAADLIEGDASVASKIDYTISGVEEASGAVTIQALADGQLPNSKGTLYTTPGGTTAIVKSITLVNTDTSARTVNLYLQRDGANSRRIIPPSLSLDANGGYIHINDKGAVVYSAAGAVKSAVTAAAHKDDHDPEDGADAVDTAAPSELAGVQASGAGSSHSLARADHAHQVQASIADNHLVTMDDAGPAVSGEYAKFTANGLEGKAASAVLTDLSGQAGASFSMNDKTLTALAGILATAETELTIAGGVITVTQFRHKVDTNGGVDATDDLDTINGGGTVNLVILRAESDVRTVVVKHNTGNIWLQGKADISLDDLEDGVMLAWDSTNSKWFDIAAGGAGAGISNVVEDISPQLGGDLDLNGKNIDFPSTINISDCLDEDNMASDSATALATQQSIKKYVDDNAGGAVASDVIWDAKGDLAGGTGADTAQKLTVGNDDEVLIADSGETTGIKWGTVNGAQLGSTFGATAGALVNHVIEGVPGIVVGLIDISSANSLNTFFAKINAAGTGGLTSTNVPYDNDTDEAIFTGMLVWRAYGAGASAYPWGRIMLWNKTQKSASTADGNTTNKLVDSGADFVTDGVAVGDVVRNDTDWTVGLVKAVDDLNTLSIKDFNGVDLDLFPDGNEDYIVYHGYRLIESVNLATDKIVTTASVDDWADNDDITTSSPIGDIANYPQWITIDLTDKLATTDVGIDLFVALREKENTYDNARIQYTTPFISTTQASLVSHYANLALLRSDRVFPLQIVGRRFCIAFTDAMDDVQVSMTIVGRYELANS